MNERLRRLALLVKRDVIELSRPALVSSAAIAGAVLIVYLVAGLFGAPAPVRLVTGSEPNGHAIVFGLLLFIGGALVTSTAFREVHDNTKNHDWFMLPASTGEKFLSRLLLTSIGYSVVLLVVYFIATLVATGVSLVFTRSHLGIFNPIDPDVLLGLVHYLIIQSIFLVGAAFFRKLHFIKTGLSLIAFGIALSIVTAMVFRIVFAGYFDGVEPTPELMRLFENFGNRAIWFERFDGTVRALRIAFEVVYWALLAPFCWVMTWFRLREAEVSDGVS